jgi:signal transduction histidine kinase
MTELLIQVPGNVEPASELMRRLAELTRKVLGCLQVGILSMDPKSLIIQPVAIAGLSSEAQRHWWTNTSGIHLNDYVADASVIERLSANEVLVLGDDQASSHYFPPTPEKRGTRLVAPMCVADQLCGILTLEYQDENHKNRPEEVALVATVAKLISLVISYKQLLDDWAEAHANELALQEINKQVNQFMLTASHELRTPLTAIEGYLELLINFDLELSPQDRRGFLEKARRGANELTLIIANVIDASRLQVETANMKLSKVPLLDAINQVLEVLEPKAQQEGRTIRLGVPANLVVMADDTRLRQILLNLISNALKYSPPGTPVDVMCDLDEQDVVVHVRDYGFGIEPEYQKRLFERFIRLERDINSAVRGAGLGLYISKQLVEAIGGRIWVESTGNPGEGSTFSFSLKRALPI